MSLTRTSDRRFTMRAFNAREPRQHPRPADRGNRGPGTSPLRICAHGERDRRRKSATFNDLPHFAGGIVPGDGIFTVWSYRAGAGRAEAFSSIRSRSAPQPPPIGASLPTSSTTVRPSKGRARWPHCIFKQPDLTRRNTRVHFVQPLKERIIREVGYGLALEGASVAALMQSMTEQAR